MDLNQVLTQFVESIDGVTNSAVLNFSENLLLASGCDRYGCTCISYEKCCGCLLQ